MSESRIVRLDRHLVQSLDLIGIVGRQAIDALCFRRFCTSCNILHMEIDAFIDHCYDLASAEDITAWEKSGPLLFEVGLGDPLPQDVAQAVPPAKVDIFTLLVQHVTEIGYCDLYGATTDGSKRHLLAVFKILDNAGIAIPDLTPFKVSSFAEWHGWGGRVPPEIVDAWRALG